jgi:gliotoxin/aspirochlorine biosynthesis thioredoxin reductase
MALRLVPSVTLYTNGDAQLSQAVAALSGRANLKINSNRIARLDAAPGDSGVVVTMADGEKISEGFLVHNPQCQVSGPWALQLGLEMTARGDIATQAPFYETTVKGVYAVGDCAMPMKSVTMAVASGTACAGGLGMVLPVEMEAEAEEG